MVDWLKNHVFIAAWASPIIALVGLVWKKSDPTNPVNWSSIMFYVGFLSAFAVIVTPGVDSNVRATMEGLFIVAFGSLMWQQREGR
jgi:hypothetical protein